MPNYNQKFSFPVTQKRETIQRMLYGVGSEIRSNDYIPDSGSITLENNAHFTLSDTESVKAYLNGKLDTGISPEFIRSKNGMKIIIRFCCSNDIAEYHKKYDLFTVNNGDGRQILDLFIKRANTVISMEYEKGLKRAVKARPTKKDRNTRIRAKYRGVSEYTFKTKEYLFVSVKAKTLSDADEKIKEIHGHCLELVSRKSL